MHESCSAHTPVAPGKGPSQGKPQQARGSSRSQKLLKPRHRSAGLAGCPQAIRVLEQSSVKGKTSVSQKQALTSVDLL